MDQTTNITPNPNPATLQNTMQTQPSAVISSDLATNVTNKNLAELDLEEANTKIRLEEDRLLRIQKDQEAAKESTTAVDKQISDTLGASQELQDPIKVQREKDLNNIKLTIDNLSRQVDPYTANILNDIHNLILTEE